jgi:hypothetical protein
MSSVLKKVDNQRSSLIDMWVAMDEHDYSLFAHGLEQFWNTHI